MTNSAISVYTYADKTTHQTRMQCNRGLLLPLIVNVSQQVEGNQVPQTAVKAIQVTGNQLPL